jgi:hypothetical protein
MIPIVEDSILGTDLDCRFHNLLNVGTIDPPPLNLASSSHPGLTDPRPPLPGSVTDASVALNAGIVQSKLSLDGQIPTAWLGTTSGTAAQGDLVEYLSRKNAPGGYAGLDSGGKVPAANLPAGVGTGTVTSVGLAMPADFVVSGSPVTGAGTLSAAWKPVSDLSWFGNKSGAAGPPQFHTDALPPTVIPPLDASLVVSGVFASARLPVAVGLGLSHAAGAVPAPGDGTGPGVGPTDYLARDMTYKPLPVVVAAIQPTLSAPVLTPEISAIDPVPVMISHPNQDDHMVFFYSLTSATGGFKEFPPGNYVPVSHPGNIWAFAAHAGCNNSPVVTLAV